MKYRKLFYAALIISISGLMSACSSILDKAPDGRTTLDIVFSDNDKIAAYLQTIYSYFPDGNNLYYFFERGPACWCDDAWDADELAVDWAPSARMYKGDASASDFPVISNDSQGNNSDFWVQYWRKIHDCAYFLSRIDTAPVKSENDRARWKAEAHLLRAYYYSELLKWFGCGMPLIDKPYSYTDDFSAVKKATYYETVQFIMADCDAAIACDQLPMRITSGVEHGRVPKGLAYAIKSRFSMYAASPLYCDGEDHWQEAYNINKEVLQVFRAAGYKLYNTLQDADLFNGPNSYYGPDRGYSKDLKKLAGMYSEYFCQNQDETTNPVDMETIFAARDWGYVYIVEGIGAQGQYKCGTCPSQELVDCFETTDGEPILDLAKPYNDPVTHLDPNYNTKNTKYNPANPYTNRDPRFYADIYYNGSKRYCWWPFAETQFSPENYPAKEGIRTRSIMTYVGEPQTGVSSTSRFQTRTGYYIRKFYNPRSGADQSQASAPQKYYRFAEILMNFAECAIHTDHLDEARAAINEVRERVGMPDLPTDLTKDELLLRYKNERRVEFALEEQRYFDVRRWTQPDGDLETTDRWITRMTITRVAMGKYTYKRDPVSFERQDWSNKWLRFPIPLSEVNRMISISGDNWQNPGW